MKLFVCAVAAIVAVISTSSFAQSTNGSLSLTRAQVEQQLVQLEQVGYRTSTHDSDYPNAIQAAEAKVQALNDSTGTAGTQTPAGAQ